jgi:PAT family beta-lactamase induction signal transducer AmpG
MHAAVMTPTALKPTPEPGSKPTISAGEDAVPGGIVDRETLGVAEGGARATGWVSSTYFAQGLPFAIVHNLSQELFTALGAGLHVVGFTSLYGIPWNLKFLWGPLVDGYGTTRRWLIGAEIALALVVAALSWPAQAGDVGLAARAFIVIAFLAATHDMAIDGFYMRTLGKDDQAALSGLRVAAYRVALLVGKGGLVWLAGAVSWRACFLAAGGLLLGLAALHAAWLPAEEKRPEARAQSVDRLYLEAFRTFVAQPGALLSTAFILVYRGGDALLFAMSAPLLQRLGLDTATRAAVSGVAGTIAGIAGSVVGGVLIARFGLRRTLTPIALLQSLALLIYLALAVTRPTLPWIVAAVVSEQLIAGVGSAAFVIFLMRRCAGAYKASHFALATALMSVATTAFGASSGLLAERLGFPSFFALAYVVSIPGVLLSLSVPKD